MKKILNETGDLDGDMPLFGKGKQLKKPTGKLKKKPTAALKSEVAGKLKTMLMNR